MGTIVIGDGWVELTRTRGAVFLAGGVPVRIRVRHADGSFAATLREAADLLGQHIAAERQDFLPIGQPLNGDVTGRFAYDLPLSPPRGGFFHWLEGPCRSTRSGASTAPS